MLTLSAKRTQEDYNLEWIWQVYNLQIIFASLISGGFQICFLKMSRA